MLPTISWIELGNTCKAKILKLSTKAKSGCINRPDYRQYLSENRLEKLVKRIRLLIIPLNVPQQFKYFN